MKLRDVGCGISAIVLGNAFCHNCIFHLLKICKGSGEFYSGEKSK